MEQPQDHADRSTGDAATSGPDRDPGHPDPRSGFVDPDLEFPVGALIPADAVHPCTGDDECRVHPEPWSYDGYVDWLRSHG